MGLNDIDPHAHRPHRLLFIRHGFNFVCLIFALQPKSVSAGQLDGCHHKRATTVLQMHCYADRPALCHAAASMPADLGETRVGRPSGRRVACRKLYIDISNAWLTNSHQARF